MTFQQTIDVRGARHEGAASAEANVTCVDIVGNSHAQTNEIRRVAPGRG